MHCSHHLFLLQGGKKGRNISPLFRSSVTKSHQVVTIASPKVWIGGDVFTTVSVSEAATDFVKHLG